MRPWLVAFAALLLAGLAQPTRAFVLPPPPPPPPTIAAGTSVGAGIYFAGGIIAVATVLCIYDIYLKANGLKNWDGTPIKGVTPRFP